MNRMTISQCLTALLAAATLCIFPVGLHADDTEIFEVTANSNTSARPKVLILFDNSGSMGTVVEGQRPAYDPGKSDYQGGISGSEFDRIYWSTNGEPPDSNSNQWFDKSVNRCASSYAGLDNQGFFSTQGARRWVNSSSQTTCQNICSLTGNPVSGLGAFICRLYGGTVTQQCETNDVPGSWSALSTSVHSPPHVECNADVINAEPDNGPGGVADGYAKTNVNNADVFSAATPEESNVDWGDAAYTFYSANYVDYWNDDSLIVDRTRMEIAQQVISDLVEANTSVDFALAVFNENDNGQNENGGRIVRRMIANMDQSQRESLVEMIEDDLSPDTWTPLCESYYEVYRYLTGSSVWYGDDKSSSDSPDRDLLAENNGTYISPTGDCAYIYVILMTDGLPTYDTSANSLIEALTGETCSNWPDDINNNGNPKNCLPELADYMSTTDLDGDDTNGNQFALTYTIGFQTDQALLQETAERGGGEYYTATDADQLASAFQGALLNILTTDSTFTSPAVAVDSFTRTQSRDDVFYAMFKPNDRVDWRGNVKKFKVAQVNGKLTVVDKNGSPAFDGNTGAFKTNASSFWSTQDGGSVEAGGVGELLASRDPASRVIYSNTGSGGALEQFNSTNVTPDAFGVGTDAALWALFGVNNQTDFTNVLAWAQGYDIVNGVPTADARDWIMGDVLHSRPLPVNYGALGSFTKENPDQRILVGTNSGFLHMFGNNDGQEDWAFFPKELAEILNQRRVNPVSNDNVYGVDQTPAIYRLDVNRDGTIDDSDGDKLWAFFGLRRGGRLMYALDLSDPDNPSFMWILTPVPAGFAEIGETWSRPVVTYIPGYVDGNGVRKPVLIFGAGYDTNKDDSGVGTADSMGRGVFIVDAQTGALVRSITPRTGSFTNVQDVRLQHSVPGDIATLDSNGDELTDRLYFGDTGGNVWRVDIGPRIPDGNDPTETWFVSHLADLNQGTVATDRRFFNRPDIVRTTIDTIPIDAVLIGSGDRTNPLATDVTNYFYMLRDPKVSPYSTPEPTAQECDPDDPDNLPLDFRCFQPITDSALYDILNQTGTDEQRATGWKLELTGLGEKNLAESTTLFGETIFTTFIPGSLLNNNPNICEPSSGEGLRYIVNIFDGDLEINQLPPGQIPSSTTTYVDEDGVIRAFEPPDTPQDPNDPDDGGGFFGPFGRFPAPYGNYWYSEDF